MKRLFFLLTLLGLVLFANESILADEIAISYQGNYNSPGSALDVVVSNGFAYLADGSLGLQIINVSNPQAPFLEANCDNPPYRADDIAVQGNYAYVADNQNGLQIVDISNPQSPVPKGSFYSYGFAIGLSVSGNYVYLAESFDGAMETINVTNPLSPFRTNLYTTNDAVTSCVENGYVYLVGNTDLQIFSLTNPQVPVLSGSYDTYAYAKGVAVSDNYAYLAHAAHGLAVIDVSSPSSPSLAGSCSTLEIPNGIFVSENYAFVVEGSSGLQVFNISNPHSPYLAGSYNTPGIAYGVYVASGLIYIADDTEGLLILSYSGSSNLPPTAVIDDISPNPAAGGTPVSFSGHGNDPDGSIISYNWRSDVNGELSTEASFITSSLTPGNHTIYFKVKDNNDAWSPEVSDQLVIEEVLAIADKQTIIDYFNNEPFYVAQEQIAQDLLNAIASDIQEGTATDKEIEALIRILLLEEAVKAAYKSSEDVGAVPVSGLTSKCIQEAAAGLFIKLLFTDLEKTLKPIKDIPFLNWFYYAVVDAGKWASGFLNSFNHSVVMQIANRLTGIIGDRSLSMKFAWWLVKEYEEEVSEIALEQVSESSVESKLKEINLWLYESGVLIYEPSNPDKYPLYVGGTAASLQAGIDDAVAEDFIEGNIETTINVIRNETVPSIINGNSQTVNDVNTTITVAEWADQAQMYILLGILIIAILALIVGILACPASAGIGCILSAISGTGIFGIMLQIQNLLSWAKIVVFTLGAGIGAFQLHANLPNQLWDVKHIAFDQGEKVRLDVGAYDNMKRYQIPSHWTDSLGAASDSVVNRLSEIRTFVETGDWQGFQGERGSLDSALNGLSSSSSIISSLLGNTYMVNNTDTLGAVDSIMHKAMAHGTETDMALSMTQLALGFASVSEPDGPDRDTLLMIIDDCISKLQTVVPAFDSALYDFDTLGFTAPPLVVITDYEITEDQTGKHLRVTIKNIAPVYVNQVVGRLICTDSSMIPTVPESDTLIEMLDSNGEGLFKWRIDTGETDTLFQLELMVEPATAPGDFIGDNRVISLYYPTEEYQFVCGDANWDGNVNLLDILYLISYLYNNPPGDPPMPHNAGDVNSDGNINLLDILYIIQYLYNSPPGPEPNCP